MKRAENREQKPENRKSREERAKSRQWRNVGAGFHARPFESKSREQKEKKEKGVI